MTFGEKAPRPSVLKELFLNLLQWDMNTFEIFYQCSTITCLNPPVLPGALSSTEVNLNLDLLFIVGI